MKNLRFHHYKTAAIKTLQCWLKKSHKNQCVRIVSNFTLLSHSHILARCYFKTTINVILYTKPNYLLIATGKQVQPLHQT